MLLVCYATACASKCGYIFLNQVLHLGTALALGLLGRVFRVQISRKLIKFAFLFVVLVYSDAKTTKKKYSVLKFSQSNNVDFSKCGWVRVNLFAFCLFY